MMPADLLATHFTELVRPRLFAALLAPPLVAAQDAPIGAADLESILKGIRVYGRKAKM